MQVVSPEIAGQLGRASWIRRMFETGAELKQRLGADQVFDFSLGNPDVAPPPAAGAALHAIADGAAQPFAFGYVPNAGLPSLRTALADKLAVEQKTPALRARNVLVTCGAAGALTAFFRAVLEPGDEVLCPAPYFVEYGFYCGHFGGVLKPVPSLPPAFEPDVPALLAAIGPRTRVVLLNSPNNPAGCIYAPATLAAIAAHIETVNRTRARPVFLLADEPYRFLAYDGAVVPPVLPLTRFALVAGSFSKSLSLAGERIGYLAIHPELPDAGLLADAVAMTTRTLGFVNAPIIGQRLAEAVLDCGVDLSVYAGRRRLMAQVLEDAGIAFSLPRGAFYFFPQAPGGDDVAFVQRLLRENILAVPGTGFGYAGHFRLCFSVADSVIERSAAGFRRAAAG
ncbi:MAG: pyridoxal phosphate-dependent aminotransferase [Kiritimatiellae bacterium]|nr:pyridoxal phosphate-dependent aminotransferase [Kiritimatiellia bacterium]